MSMHESSQGRGGGLRGFRVSPMNAVFTLLFLVAGVLFWVYDSWVTGLVFFVAAVAQYAIALFARRGRGASDVWRASAFEPSDERDRAILTKASALVAYVVASGSMVAFLVAVLAFRSETVLVAYLAVQTIVINIFWGVTIWVMARHG
ncbi:hypothetical protein [Brevibacterium yomogidense]|uniref:hypothetical protein n=1 Tax=Brevibacterium yomogidense TaxID=946573 RepID=UPI0018E04DE4|nr:hypothetical protein [Brevibacterium yomogidense]